MAKNTIENFAIGDQVYHLSNPKLIMVAIEIQKDINEISCRWVDKDGRVQCTEFMAEELGNKKDSGPILTSLGD